MKLALSITAIGLSVLAAAWLVFSWFEADTEISVLCSMFHPGFEREHVVKTLDTGEHLQYREEAGGDPPTIYVDSFYNLGSSHCVIEFDGGRVASSTYTGPSESAP